jgi:spermidine/putrescine-binding protein
MKQAERSRRAVLQAAAAGLASAALPGCRWASRTAPDAGGERGNTLKVFNWSDYIADGVIDEFAAEHGCSVVYDNYSSDAELETRMATGGGSYDVVFPSDRAMQPLLAKDLLQPLDRSRLTNFRHLDAKFLGAPFDPKNAFSVPYFWGTVAVGIRADKIRKPVAGFEVLFDEEYAGRITMLGDMENVVAAVLAYLGRPLNSVEPADLAAAKALLARQKPLVQAYTSDSYKERLIAGDAWASLGWSGDFMQAAGELDEAEGEIRVIVPQSGTMIWLDSMAIPRAAQNVQLAHAFIDYLLQPEIAVRNAESVSYATPNAAALKLLPAKMRADESIYPPAATLARCDWLQNRGAKIERIEALWRAVRA